MHALANTGFTSSARYKLQLRGRVPRWSASRAHAIHARRRGQPRRRQRARRPAAPL